jgi:hypothetical protein
MNVVEVGIVVVGERVYMVLCLFDVQRAKRTWLGYINARMSVWGLCFCVVQQVRRKGLPGNGEV